VSSGRRSIGFPQIHEWFEMWKTSQAGTGSIGSRISDTTSPHGELNALKQLCIRKAIEVLREVTPAASQIAGDCIKIRTSVYAFSARPRAPSVRGAGAAPGARGSCAP